MKRFISLLLVFCLAFPTAFAEEAQEPQSKWDSVREWLNQAAEGSSERASEIWSSVSEWVTQTWSEVSAWAVHKWNEVSAWTKQAWDNSSKWVSRAWTNGSNKVETNWDHFIVWLNNVVAGEPYAWIEDEVRAYGASAYNEYVKVHSLIDSDPDEAQLREKYDAMLYELFVPDEDKDILWNMIQQWTEEKALSVEETAILALPFLVRLQIEGETVIGDDAQFSGPVIGQYLLTVLEALQLDSTDKADMLVKVLDTAVDEMIHSTILGGDSAPSGMIAPSGN